MRNSLYTEYVRLVRQLRPYWVLFENVPGMLLYDRGSVARTIIDDFNNLGYRVAPIILLAADYGVPQLRRRLFFIGNRTDQPLLVPRPTHGSAELWKEFALPFTHLSRIGHNTTGPTAAHVTFDQACGDLPSLTEAQHLDDVPYLCRPTSAYQRLMRTKSRSVRQHIAFRLSDTDRLAAQMLKPGENWRALPVDATPERFRRIKPYDATTMLRRLCADRPAYTITTKFNEASTGAFIHPTDNRTLSIREAARLQSFPDDFIFQGSPPQMRVQIGNAVPPLLALALAEAILPLALEASTGQRIPPVRATDPLDATPDVDAIGLHSPRARTKSYFPQPMLPRVRAAQLKPADPAA
jgi:DNA (cytosine-5)-methyltransferase 1